MTTLQGIRNRRAAVSTPSFYFLYYAAAASLVPFLTVYYEHLGFSGRQIGLLAAVPPLASLFGAPAWSAAADASKRHRLVLLTAIAGALLASFALSRAAAFSWIIVVLVAFALFSAPIMSLVDASTMAWLGERRDRYGHIRLWGAVGWGVAAPIAGRLIESNGVRWAFYGYFLLMALGWLVGWLLPMRATEARQPFWSNIGVLARNRQWLLFSGVVFIGGVCLSVIGSFLFLHMLDLGIGEGWMGLALTFATISELPILFFSNALLGRWGARGLLTLSLSAYVVRTLAYSLISAPWLFLVVQLLHGLTFSAMWVAGVSYADLVAPEGLGSTAQGLFSGVLLGLGGIGGGLLGGLLFDTVGAVVMFRSTAVLALAGLALLVLLGRERAASSVPATRL